MSVAWPQNAVEAEAIVIRMSVLTGPLSGEDSDMNVQAT